MIDLILLGLFLWIIVGGLTAAVALNEDRKLKTHVVGGAEVFACFVMWPVAMPMILYYFWQTRNL